MSGAEPFTMAKSGPIMANAISQVSLRWLCLQAFSTCVLRGLPDSFSWPAELRPGYPLPVQALG